MKIIDYTLPCDKNNSIPKYYTFYGLNARFLFFDIETTGFIAKNTTLYLIGALWYDNSDLHIRQWFNEDGCSEKDLLTNFIDFCNQFTHLIHFNGNGFDLPYLKQKADLYNIPFYLDTRLKQIDIYKEIRGYKSIFALDSMKQTSIESFLGIHRQDKYTGRELIHIYQKYATTPTQAAEDILLLHNHDDLLGMPQISQILNYKAFFENTSIDTYVLTETYTTLDIQLTFDLPALPRRISITKNNFYLNAFEQKATLQIPLYKGTLKHYFTDYKNYYYLPKEDMAIHKTIATYVENDNKQKATKNTCYIKKEGIYIPCLNKEYTEQFQISYSEKAAYQTLQSLMDSSVDIQKEYIKTILRTFI